MTGVRVLVVDDSKDLRSALAGWLASKGATIDEATNGLEAVESAEATEYDLVLLDIQMPVLDGISALPQLVAANPDTPIVIASSLDELDTVRRSIRNGAYDYIVKPFDFSELEATVQRALQHNRLAKEIRSYRQHLEHLVAERTKELSAALDRIRKTYESTILALGSALETRDIETEAHSIRVARFTLLIVRELGVTGEEQLKNIEWGAYLHDIGKIGVPDHVLMKPGELNSEEWLTMRRHPSVGKRLVERIDFLAGAVPIIFSHHERWDGYGYPRGLSGTDIPLEARAFAIADTVDAVTSDRPYREGRPLAAAMEILQSESGTQFDPEAVAAFTRIQSQMPPEIGKMVEK